MPESLKKITKAATSVISDVLAPIGKVGTQATNQIKDWADKVPGPDLGPGITRPKPKDTPLTPLPPTRMPTSADKSAARRKSILEQLRRRGRASTILTEPSDTLGV